MQVLAIMSKSSIGSREGNRTLRGWRSARGIVVDNSEVRDGGAMGSREDRPPYGVSGDRNHLLRRAYDSGKGSQQIALGGECGVKEP